MVFRKLAVDAVNRAAAVFDGAAGKSVNVAKALQSLGEPALATGFLGGSRGEFIREMLRARGIELDFVSVRASTRLCVTVLDKGAGTHTELVEEGAAAEPADFDRLLGVIRRRAAGCRAAVMSGAIAPGGAADFYGQCVRLAQAAGALSVVDAQGAALTEALKAKPGLVKPNRLELAATVGRKLGDEAAVKEAMMELARRGAERVVITAGREPALAWDGRTLWRVSPPAIEALNPIGSGDCFTAGLVWRLVAGDDLGEAVRWGAAAGAANALTPMPGDLDRADVVRLAAEAQMERVT
jgi:tagatose 6-phosphate kinase